MCRRSPSLRSAAFPPPLALTSFVRGITGTLQPSDSSHLPRRLHLIDFPSWPCTAEAGTGEVRSPRFRRLPFMRNGVSDRGRAVTPCMTVHNILPSTLSTASASARLNFSRLNIPLHMTAVYASRPSSPAAPQHLLEGGSLLPYPHWTFTGWKAPASPGALRVFFLVCAQWCYRWRARRYSAPRQPPPAAATSTACDLWAVRNRPRRSTSPPRPRQRCAVWPRLANAWGSGRPQTLLPPVADDSVPPCPCWYRGPLQSGCHSILHRPLTRQPSTGCVPWSAAGRVFAHMYQHVKPFPLLSAEPHHVPLHGNLFRGHNASPSLRSHRFGDCP
jgi:hypothetical protein